MNTPNKNGSQIKQTDTAHRDWDVKWQTEEGRSDWIEPERAVIDCIPFLKERGIQTVLDLGCGVGRHALLLAEAGFKVHAMDASPAAIQHLQKECSEKGYEIETHIAEMTRIPLEKDSVDYLLTWNVVYHGDLPVVLRTLSEILRVIRPGGFFQGTMLSKRNSEVGEGTCIAKDTYVNSDSFEKRHPHFYCNASELVALLSGFEPLSIEDREHRRGGSYHWQFLAEKQ